MCVYVGRGDRIGGVVFSRQLISHTHRAHTRTRARTHTAWDWLGLLSPAFITLLLTKVSVPMTEKVSK